MSEEFELYDLQVEVTGDPATYVCSHKRGYAFKVVGENLVFDGKQPEFSMYSLAALLPHLPARQRAIQANDWMATDLFIACPDPYCGAQFKISHTTRSTFKHSEVTKVPLTVK